MTRIAVSRTMLHVLKAVDRGEVFAESLHLSRSYVDDGKYVSRTVDALQARGLIERDRQHRRRWVLTNAGRQVLKAAGDAS